MRIDVDDSEIRALSVDLGRLGTEAAVKVKKTTVKAALSIKQQLQRESRGSARFLHMPASISYETVTDRDGFGADIGPLPGRQQGSLGHIAYDGTATTPPRFADPAGALEAEQDRWLDYISQAVSEGL